MAFEIIKLTYLLTECTVLTQCKCVQVFNSWSTLQQVTLQTGWPQWWSEDDHGGGLA